MKNYENLHHVIIEVDEKELNEIFQRIEKAKDEIYKAYDELRMVGIAKIIPAGENDKIDIDHT